MRNIRLDIRRKPDGTTSYYFRKEHQDELNKLIIHFFNEHPSATGDTLCVEIVVARLWGLGTEDLDVVRWKVAGVIQTLVSDGRLQAPMGRKLSDSFYPITVTE